MKHVFRFLLLLNFPFFTALTVATPQNTEKEQTDFATQTRTNLLSEMQIN
jgi:hypothetical protein